jgi:ubiquinone/menaquinone biosynthesis C-methylase UbiE
MHKEDKYIIDRYSKIGYDKPSMKAFLAEIYRILDKIIPLSKDISFLDIGSGKGYFLRYLKEMGFANLTGIDPNEGFLGDNVFENISLGSFESNSFSDNTFDVVFCCHTLHHLNQKYPVYALQEMFRISKKYIVIVEINNTNIPVFLISLLNFCYEKNAIFYNKFHVLSLIKKIEKLKTIYTDNLNCSYISGNSFLYKLSSRIGSLPYNIFILEKSYKEENKTISQVKSFWNKNPLLSGEIKDNIGTKEWFNEFDKIKTGDIFNNDLSKWTNFALSRKRILDVGCGPGYWNRVFSKFSPEYFGIDISTSSVDLAKTSQSIFGLKGKIFVCSAENLAFPGKSFDYIISEGVIHHTPDTQKCIDEIHRVLKDGGRALISVYHKNFILRSKLIFRIVIFFMRLMNIRLAGRGREKIFVASSPDDFVRMYDGAENPIGKSYTKHQLKTMFYKFSKIKFSWYYIPWRAMPFSLPVFLKKIICRIFGLMILVKAEK